MPKWLNLRPPSVIEGTPRAFSIRKSSTPVQSRVNYSGREDKTSHTHTTLRKKTHQVNREETQMDACMLYLHSYICITYLHNSDQQEYPAVVLKCIKIIFDFALLDFEYFYKF